MSTCQSVNEPAADMRQYFCTLARHAAGAAGIQSKSLTNFGPSTRSPSRVPETSRLNTFNTLWLAASFCEKYAAQSRSVHAACWSWRAASMTGIEVSGPARIATSSTEMSSGRLRPAAAAPPTRRNGAANASLTWHHAPSTDAALYDGTASDEPQGLAKSSSRNPSRSFSTSERSIALAGLSLAVVWLIVPLRPNARRAAAERRAMNAALRGRRGRATRSAEF
mmetsp:Transcript_29982/g.89728  ORF Transcript_29982/g.89728 Transcript_29982/m.89728 type:complete len:223 (+) Transcript_29982:269-937(+)